MGIFLCTNSQCDFHYLEYVGLKKKTRQDRAPFSHFK